MTDFTLVMHTRPDPCTPEQRYMIADLYMGESPEAALGMGLYEASRTISADDLEDLFHKCQHIEPVENHPMDGIRSLSVGDFAVTPDGTVYLCARVGWNELIGPWADQVRDLAAKIQDDKSHTE